MFGFLRRKPQSIEVQAFRDVEAGVWIATSEDVPGLVLEEDHWDDLVARLEVAIPELLELNGINHRRADVAPIDLVAHQSIRACVAS